MKDSDIYASGGTSAKLWVSGATVKKWDTVQSPLDGEIYRRKTATGSGTVDPADDVINYRAISYRRVGALAPWLNSTPAQIGWTTTTSAAATAQVAGPAINAATRTQMVSITGRGGVRFLAYRSGVSTGTVRVEIIVDGRTVLDITGTPSNGGCWVYSGLLVPTAAAADWLPIPDGALEFTRTFEVYVTRSVAGAANISQLWYAYDGDA